MIRPGKLTRARRTAYVAGMMFWACGMMMVLAFGLMIN